MWALVPRRCSIKCSRWKRKKIRREERIGGKERKIGKKDRRKTGRARMRGGRSST
jgi:hypothetical protein